MNHIPDKAEIIIQGGTFCSFPKDYQDEVVIYILKAMNDFSEMFFINDKLDFDKFKDFSNFLVLLKIKRGLKIADKILKFKGNSNIEKEQLRNETSKIRSTALVIETKPDWCMESEIDEILKLGTTRVELGIQTLKMMFLKQLIVGYTLKDSVKSIQLLKDSF